MITAHVMTLTTHTCLQKYKLSLNKAENYTTSSVTLVRSRPDALLRASCCTVGGAVMIHGWVGGQQ